MSKESEQQPRYNFLLVTTETINPSLLMWIFLEEFYVLRGRDVLLGFF